MTTKKNQDGSEGPPRSDPGAERSSHLGYLAHEVRNPLSTALWTAELLARLSPSERGGPRGEKLAAICLRSVNRIRLLVEDHLLCERLDAGGYPIKPEAVPLAACLDGLRARRPEGAGALTLTVEAGLRALADRALLERALDGLLAVAAGPGEAAVRIEAIGRSGTLEIRISGGPVGSLADPGRGAPSEQRGRALALAAARRVALALGGALELEGEGYLLSIPAA